MSVGTIILFVILLAFPSVAIAQTSCGSDEGCCINGVQYQRNFFPFCSKKQKKTVECIWPGKAFLRAAKVCKLQFEKQRSAP